MMLHVAPGLGDDRCGCGGHSSLLRSLASTVVMPDIRRSSTLPGRADPIAPGRSVRSTIAAFRKLEAQRSADGIGLGKPQGEPLTHAICFAAFVPDQRSRR